VGTLWEGCLHSQPCSLRSYRPPQMQAWRRVFAPEDARFVCVCVDGRPEATAREFQRLYFDDSITNAFVGKQADMPRFPTQLGCQGLVVLDADGSFVTMRSPAYLDHRNQAFQTVENALRTLIARAKPSTSSSPAAAANPAAAAAATSAGAAPRRSARFAANACSDDAEPLDDADDFELHAVGHAEMDAEHKEIEGLMRDALSSCSRAAMERLAAAFAAHATHEEALLRAAERSNGDAEATPEAFRASASHTTDHERVVREIQRVAHAADGHGVVAVEAVRGACRAIVEHAVTYDAAYAGQV
jgi:hemerythrin